MRPHRFILLCLTFSTVLAFSLTRFNFVSTIAAENPFNIQPTSLDSISATIAWRTSGSSTSKLEYGTTDSYGTSSTDAASVTSHNLSITSLLPNTQYHYRVGSMDGSIISGDNTFTTPYSFGTVVNDSSGNVDTSNGTTELASGVRYKTFDLSWTEYEPTNDGWDSDYISAKKAELQTYQDQGFEVVLDIGSHYSPSWVRSIDANALFVNQFGDNYAPGDAGTQIANVVFNDTVRSELQEYIERIYSDFGNAFYALRVGGSYYGELHYPPNNYNSRVNSFWGYDANAQGSSSNRPSGINVNPVPGWIPNPVANGTFENSDDGKWTLADGVDTITTNSPHRGSYILEKANPGSFTNQTIQDVAVVSGRTYRYSVWAKTSDPDTSTPPCLQITTTGGTEIVSPQCAYSTSWSQITGTFTPNVDTVRVVLVTYASEGGVVLSFDDMAIMDDDFSYDADHSDSQDFWEWYRDSLINYQNWQISTLKNTGFSNNLFVLYPDFGIRQQADTNEVTEAISYDLSRTTRASVNGLFSRATDWESQISGLTSTEKVFAYTTWVDGTESNSPIYNDSSSDKGDWSPAKYLAYLVDGDLPLFGENTGSNNYSAMQTAFSNMTQNGFSGMLWFSEPQLLGGSYATLAQYKTETGNLDSTSPYNLNLTLNGGNDVHSRDVSFSLSASDNFSSNSNMDYRISQNFSFSDASWQDFASSGTFHIDGDQGSKTLYLQVRDENSNTSNVYQSSVNYSVEPTTSQPSAPICTDVSPVSSPWLYSATSTGSSSVLIKFTQVSDPVSGYVLEYGTEPGEYQFAADNIGGKDATEYEVKSLSPNTTYYFRIRASNGCATGAWSNELSATTKGLIATNQLEITDSELKPQDQQNNSGTSTTTQESGSQDQEEEDIQQKTYEVDITVKNEGGQAVQGAEVTLHSDPKTTYTNQDGIAHFESVEQGDHMVLISYNGYEGEQSINLTGETKKFELSVVVKQQNVLLAPQVLALIGIMSMIIVGLIFRMRTLRKK